MANGTVAADLMVHVGADVKDAQSGLDSVGKKVANAGNDYAKTAKTLGIGSAAIIGGLGLAVKSAGDFEQSIANIVSLDSDYASHQKEISDLALKIGKDTVFGANDGALAINEMLKAGVSLTDTLNGGAMAAANLAVAGGIQIPEAATVMSNSMNMFAQEGLTATQIADGLAAAANASASDISDLAMGMAQGGSAAAQLGISFYDTNAALALFSNYGIKGSDAGTSLKTMLQRLAAPTDDARAAMQALGINAFDAAGNFIGLDGVAGQLKTAFKNLTKEQQAQALATIFGSDASRVAAVLANEGAEGFDKMAKKVREQGVAARMGAAKMNTLNGAIEQLKGTMETIAIVMGTAFVPAIHNLADGVTTVANKFLDLPEPVQHVIGYLGAATGGVLGLTAAVLKFGPIFSKAIALVSTASLPLLAVAAAAGLLYLAWTKNFGGIQDKTKQFVDNIGGFFDGLKKRYHDLVYGTFVKSTYALNGIDLGGSRLTKGIGRFEAMMTIAGETLDKLGIHISGVFSFLSQLNDYLGKVAKGGHNLGSIFKGASPATLKFAQAIGDTVRAVMKFDRVWRKYGLLAALRTVPKSLRAIGRDVGNIFRNLGFENFGNGIKKVVNDISYVLGNFINLVDDIFHGRWSDALSDVGNILWDVFSLAVDSLKTIGGLIVDVFNKIDWAAVGSVLWTGAQNAFNFLRDKIAGIDWVGLASKAWDGLSTAFNAIPWGTLASIAWGLVVDGLSALADGGLSILSVAVSVGEWLKAKIPAFASWLWDQITDKSLELFGVIANVYTWAKGTLPGFAGWLWNQLTDKTLELFDVIVNVYTWAKGTIRDVGPDVAAWIAGTSVQLYDWVIDITSSPRVQSKIQPDMITGVIHDWIGPQSVKLLDWTLLVGLPTSLQGGAFELGKIARAIFDKIPDVVVELKDHWKLMLFAPALIVLGPLLVPLAIAKHLYDTLGPVGLLKWTLSISVMPAIKLGQGFGLKNPIELALLGLKVAADLITWSLNLKVPGIKLSVSDVVGWIWDKITSLGKLAIQPFNWDAALQKPAFPDLSLSKLVKWIEDALLDLGTPHVNVGFILNPFRKKSSDPPVTTQNPDGTGTTLHNIGTGVNAGSSVTLPDGTVVNALPDVGSGPDSYGNALPAVDISAYKKSLDDAATYMGSFVSNVSALAKAAGSGVNVGLSEGMGTAVASANLFLNTIATAVGSFVSNISALAKAAGSGFNANLSVGMGTAVASANLFLDTIATATGRFVTTLTNNAKTAGSQFNANLSVGLGTAVASANLFLNTIASNAQAWGSKMATAGAHGGSQFATSLYSTRGAAESAGSVVMNSALNGMSGGYSDAFSKGANVGAGYAAGVRSGIADAYNAGAALGAASAQGQRDATRQRSPSKLFYHQGVLDTLGYINALDDQTPKIYAAAVDAFTPNLDSASRSSNLRSLQSPNTGKVVNQYIQIDARFDDVADMVRAAEFVRDINPTRKLYSIE